MNKNTKNKIDQVVQESKFMNDIQENMQGLKESIDELRENLKKRSSEKSNKSFKKIKKDNTSRKQKTVEKKSKGDYYSQLYDKGERPNPKRSFRVAAGQGDSDMDGTSAERVEAKPPDISKLRGNFRAGTGSEAFFNSDNSDQDNKRKSNIRRNLDRKPDKKIDNEKLKEEFPSSSTFEESEVNSYYLRD